MVMTMQMYLVVVFGCFCLGWAAEIDPAVFKVAHLEMAGCKIAFVQNMSQSSLGLEECPKFFQEADDCFNNHVIDFTFKDINKDEHNHTVDWLRQDFGGMDHFCTYGLLDSMEGALDGIEPKDCINASLANYSFCEKDFRKMFAEQFGMNTGTNHDLCGEFKRSKECQTAAAYGCRIPINENNKHFFEEVYLNPYCKNDQEKISETVDKFETGENTSSNSATYITIAVVVIALVGILIVVFVLLRHRDKQRAGIRQKKASVKSQKTEQNDGVEMEPLASGAVVTSNDQVSSA